jgi:hypothetical protein
MSGLEAKKARGKYQNRVFSQGMARVPPFLADLGHRDRADPQREQN